MTPRLDPLSLRLFVTVVEEGTIAAAAARENIAAAAVSRRLSELEQMLGTPLLVRDNRGVSATPAGLSLLYMARGVLNGLADIVARMRDVGAGRGGTVRLLANISALGQFLPELLYAFANAYPAIEVLVEQHVSLSVTKGVAEHRGDIGIYTHMPHGADLTVVPFRRDRLVLCAPAGHPLATSDAVSFADTLDHRHVVLNRGTHLAFQLVKAANDLGRVLRVAIEVESYDALYLMVRAGMGLGVMPEGCAANYRADGVRVLALDEPWATRELMLCTRAKEPLSPAAALLRTHLTAAPST